MSQQSRLAALITAIGADIKARAVNPLIASGTRSEVRLTNNPAGASPKRKIEARVTDESGSVILSKNILASDGSSDFGKPPKVSVLPTIGVEDEDEVDFLADAANDIYWRLKYDESIADAYKWRYVGGPAMESGNDGLVTLTNEANYVYSTPTITVPLIGIYDVEYGGRCYTDSGTSSERDPYMTVRVNGASIGDYLDWYNQNNNQRVAFPTSVKRRVTVPNVASRAIQCGYKINPGTGNWHYRMLRVLPLRVG